MGIIRNKIQQTAQQAKNKFTDLSEMSQSQFQQLDKRKEEYLTAESEMFTQEKSAVRLAEKNLSAISSEVFHSYLPQLSSLYVPLQETIANAAGNCRVISFDITKWVTDTTENSIEKLSNVYQVLIGEECSVALIYTRTKEKGCLVRLAVAHNGEGNEPSIAQSLEKRLRSALLGNFPGTECSTRKQERLEFEKGKSVSVAAISNLATEKSEKFISQSMEKLLDGIVPKDETEDYHIVLLASPVNDSAPYIQRLHEQYTAISPFAAIQKQFSISESASAISSVNVGLNLGGKAIGIGGGLSAATTGQAGKNTGKTTTYTNYAVKHTLELIEAQMKRLEQCQALGMWRFAAYVISPSYTITQNVAHTYVSLTQGTNSYLEPSAINVWQKDDNAVSSLLQSLSGLQHPSFLLKDDVPDEMLLYPSLVDATTLVSSSELAHSLNFPQKSVPGLPVIQCAAFGRNVICREQAPKSDSVNLGSIYHMLQEEQATVDLDKNALTAHTFITGSTGAGKSTTVCRLLREAEVPFLVIEPAKGEYRHEFPNAAIYSTNPKQGQLLQLNPFWFPSEIHVLEHMDRLVEIFNACWPMYAAMPAILKEAIEEAYRDAGWDLDNSVNPMSKDLFPGFADVLENIRKILQRSEFSADNKSDYTGALVTRLRSLTNGINGRVFTPGVLSNAELFAQDTVVDLSRVGSSETKALIMGILVLQLQEYRMSEQKGSNQELRHLTVLEEAHHLLCRTSFEQASESANLQGKSVEMLTNAIAEMRTYGEGFVIADQSPGLLDMAAIRNTNTKIIHRLPDLSDRELVGRAAALNDEQIAELSRLETGVAAVYQNNWSQPVLCKVPKPGDHGESDSGSIPASPAPSISHKSILDYFLGKSDTLPSCSEILKMPLRVSCKRYLLTYWEENPAKNTQHYRELRSKILYSLFNTERAMSYTRGVKTVQERERLLIEHLEPAFSPENDDQKRKVLSDLLAVYASRSDSEFYRTYMQFVKHERSRG